MLHASEGMQLDQTGCKQAVFACLAQAEPAKREHGAAKQEAARRSPGQTAVTGAALRWQLSLFAWCHIVISWGFFIMQVGQSLCLV